MRNPDRIPKVINKLNELWLLYPDLRFGQLFTIIENATGEKHISFNLEDDRWLETMEQMIESTKLEN